MTKQITFFKLKISLPLVILGLILLIAFFFRVYKLDIFYIFEHDQDLYSWIVKDIWIDHHLRIIGQVTSIEGVFIGPLFYYLLIPFYVIGGMNPLSATWLATLIGLLTIGSIYYVFSRFFGVITGLFGAAIYATSLGVVFFDRWVVPTQPTFIWCVWLLYTALALIEGRTKSLIVAAILLGTIWHIHVALLPLMPLLLLAFFLNPKNLKNLTWKLAFTSLVILLILTLPFWIFEFKHQFLQTRSLLFTSGNAGRVPTGAERLAKVIDAFVKILNSALFQDWNLPQVTTPVLSLLLLILAAVKKLVTTKQLIIILSWLAVVFVIQMVTHNPISEYYVINITVLPILLLARGLDLIYQQRRWRIVSFVLIGIYMIVNAVLLINKPEALHLYAYKKKTIDFIHQDYLKHGYKCMSISFIANYGTAVGFRYPVWWEGMHQIQVNSKTPAYTIVIPYDIDPKTKSHLDAQFGLFGVILPKEQNIDPALCNDPKLELIPLLGFTN